MIILSIILFTLNLADSLLPPCGPAFLQAQFSLSALLPQEHHTCPWTPGPEHSEAVSHFVLFWPLSKYFLKSQVWAVHNISLLCHLLWLFSNLEGPHLLYLTDEETETQWGAATSLRREHTAAVELEHTFPAPSSLSLPIPPRHKAVLSDASQTHTSLARGHWAAPLRARVFLAQLLRHRKQRNISSQEGRDHWCWLSLQLDRRCGLTCAIYHKFLVIGASCCSTMDDLNLME